MSFMANPSCGVILAYCWRGVGTSPKARNPKRQIPNPKQYQMIKIQMPTEIQMSKYPKLFQFVFWILGLI
jgi:hypothetical protein